MDNQKTKAILKDGVPHYLGFSGRWLHYAVTFTATTGFMLFGYDQGIMGGIVSAPQFTRVFTDLAGESYQASVMRAFYTAIYELGCLAGAIFALLYGNRLGRRKNIMIGAYIVVLGVIIQISAIPGHGPGYQFVIGRTITGVGVGLNTATIPSWQAECSKSHNRGLHICIEASMIAIGTMIAYWIDFGLSFIDNSISWRLPIGLQVVFAVVLVAATLFLPESPRWLLANQREAEGERVIAALAGLPIDHKDVQLEKRIIMDSLAASAGQLRVKDVFTNGPTQHFRRMIVSSSSQFFQQVGGCNAVIYFAPVIFQEYLLFDRQLALILGGVNVTVYAISALLSYPMIERAGRRKMFLWGSAGQAISMFLASFCLIPYNLAGNDNSTATYGAVVGLFLFLIVFGCTWLELPWLYPAELTASSVRTPSNAISTMTNWSWNFAIVMATPPMLNSLGGFGTFLFFGVLNVLFIPVIFFFYPEPKGRTLEELDIIFAKAYKTNTSYVRESLTMPFLSPAEIDAEGAKWCLGKDHEDVASASSSREATLREGRASPDEKSDLHEKELRREESEREKTVGPPAAV